jgi:hypothetical protein
MAIRKLGTRIKELRRGAVDSKKAANVKGGMQKPAPKK